MGQIWDFYYQYYNETTKGFAPSLFRGEGGYLKPSRDGATFLKNQNLIQIYLTIS